MLGLHRTGSDVAWTVWERVAERSAPDSGFLFVNEDRTVRRLAWTDMVQKAESAAAHLYDVGVRKGDRVLVLSKNSVELALAHGAIARLGAIAAPTNVALAPGEIAYQVADTAPTVVLTQSGCAAAAAEAVRLAEVKTVVLMLDGDGEDKLDYEASASSLPGVSVDPMDPNIILYTSGSTSRPKGVIHSQRSSAEEANRVVDAWAIRPDDVIFSHMPMYHVAGLYCCLLPGMYRGATVATGASFSASRWTSDLRATGATLVPIVGAQVRMLMANASIEPGRDRDHRVRLTPCGMALPQDMEREFEERFGTGPLYAISGSTEGVGLTYIEPAYSRHRWPSLGRPAADREIAILDELGRPVPFGTQGELCIRAERGGGLMLEYWNNPEATTSAIVDGWYHTSDIGKMDEDGYVYFVDRKKDIIKRAGENVSASEVEQVLCQFPGVFDAAVVGKPDPIRDWAIVAFLEVHDGETVDLEGLFLHCAQHLAKYKVPEDVRIVVELPRVSTGKLEKKSLLELFPAERHAAPVAGA